MVASAGASHAVLVAAADWVAEAKAAEGWVEAWTAALTEAVARAVVVTVVVVMVAAGQAEVRAAAGWAGEARAAV